MRSAIIRVTVLAVLFSAASSFVYAQSPAPKPGTFVLRDFISRTWRNEYVSWPVNPQLARDVTRSRSVVGPDGKFRPIQVSQKDGVQRVGFLADLDPMQTANYSLSGKSATEKSDLRVEVARDTIRLTNNLTGVELARSLSNGAGPIKSVRLKSGAWACGSGLKPAKPVVGYIVTVTAKGPVFCEAVCSADFGGGEKWNVTVRMYANEPVILVDETSTLKDQAVFTLNLSADLDPDTLLYRVGNKDPLGKNATWRIENGDVYILEPWLHWWYNPRQGNCFSLYKNGASDVLAVAAREAGAWVDPSLKEAVQAGSSVKVVKDQTGIHADFPVKTGARKWMIEALDREASLQGMDEHSGNASLLPYRYLIKHGHFPLDMVKDYVLDWNADFSAHPHMFVKKEDVVKLRAQLPPIDLTQLNSSNLDDLVYAYMRTGNSELETNLAEHWALTWMQQSIDALVDQNGIPFGCAPHHLQAIGMAMGVADAVLGSDELPLDTKKHLAALAAFLGYTLDRPDYWSPERGYSANPNMTTSVFGYKLAVGCLLSDHPQAKTWVSAGLGELKRQFDNWADSNGGWLEAPHYAMVSYDQIVGGFLMARNAKFADYLYEPKMKKIMEWFAKTSSPPDSRIGGYRHLLPIGNTWMQEPCGEFAIAAYLWKDRDPKFSARMRWMWKQQRSYPYPGIGGEYPGLAGYRRLMSIEALPEEAPHYGSEMFPSTGVVLRNKYPSDRETMLYLIQGDNHAHYDDDSGSVMIFGKGRIVADEFGYTGMAPPDDHSMVTPPGGAGIMHVSQFSPMLSLDYVLGQRGNWTRRIAFVKDDDPLAPNYFVIRDTYSEPTDTTCRMWFNASAVAPAGSFALVSGKEDVDTDVFFFQKDSANLATEVRTRHTGCGMLPDGNLSAMDITLNGLIATQSKGREFAAVIYPRLKTETAPRFTSIADGKGVKVESTAGTDYVFLSPEPLKWSEGDVSFEGTCGLVKERGGKTTLALGAAGKIGVSGKTLASDKPDCRDY